MPRLFLFGGPNGVGKTTLAMHILPALGCRRFVNPQAIAFGLSPLCSELDAWQAGRLAIEQVRKFAARGEDFGLESTLSGQKVLGCVWHCLQRGYSLHTFQVRLADPQLAVARVAMRVRDGGIEIPKAKILQNYQNGRFTFSSMYRPMSDSWMLFENSSITSQQLGVVMPKPMSEETAKIAAVAKTAIDDAIETHRRMGRAVVTWENGHIRWLQPHEIEPRMLSSEIAEQKNPTDGE